MEKYEPELKRTRNYLKRLENKDPEIVFHCPVCDQWVLKFQYDLEKQGMCNSCFAKHRNKKIQEQANQLVGAIILEVSTQKTSEMWMPNGFHEAHEIAHITKLKVKLKNGKVLTLNEEERAPALLL